MPTSFVQVPVLTPIFFLQTEASRDRKSQDTFVTFSKSISSPPAISRAIRTNFESDKETDWTEPSLDATSSAERGETSERELNVEVRVERTVRVEDPPWMVERGICRARGPFVSAGSWETATHDTRADEILATRDPMMMTIR